MTTAPGQDDPVEDIHRQALDILARLNPGAARVMETQGRHVSDRLAAERQDRRDRIDASQAISAARPREDSGRFRAMSRTAERRNEIRAAARPRAGDYPGTDASQHQGWRDHFSRAHGIDTSDWDDVRDDAEQDWVMSGCEPEDFYAGSPDLDVCTGDPRAAADDDAMEQTR